MSFELTCHRKAVIVAAAKDAAAVVSTTTSGSRQTSAGMAAASARGRLFPVFAAILSRQNQVSRESLSIDFGR
jgi:hypothetical protein